MLMAMSAGFPSFSRFPGRACPDNHRTTKSLSYWTCCGERGHGVKKGSGSLWSHRAGCLIKLCAAATAVTSSVRTSGVKPRTARSLLRTDAGVPFHCLVASGRKLVTTPEPASLPLNRKRNALCALPYNTGSRRRARLASPRDRGKDDNGSGSGGYKRQRRERPLSEPISQPRSSRRRQQHYQ